MRHGMRFPCWCVLVLFCVSGASAEAGDTAKVVTTGNFAVDMFGFREMKAGPALVLQQDETAVPAPRDKSPWLAAGMSAIIPGAGEFYSESYWKSAAFLAVDVVAWAFAYAYDKKGDRQTDFYQNYADAHWSVVRYVQYAQTNIIPAAARDGYAVIIPGTAGRVPWDQVNWSELNRMERDIAGVYQVLYYSHTLPPHGDQQYFEEIGKYAQFNQGWEDANQGLSSDYETILNNISPMSTYYMGQRGQANTYYEHATTFVGIAIVNHIASAIDAALSASSYNRHLHAEMGFQTVPNGNMFTRVPVVKLRLDI